MAFIALAVASISLTSCSNEETAEAVPANPTPDVSGFPTATIKGIAHATLSEAPGAATTQYAPVGTKVYLTIAPNQLPGIATNQLPGITTTYNAETTVGADGTFSFTVPTCNAGVSPTIKGNNFTAAYTKSDNTTETRLYTSVSATPSLTSILPGSNSYVTIDYAPGTLYK